MMPDTGSHLGRLVLACGVLVLLVAVLLAATFPGDFLLGSADYWQRPVGDLSEHIIGGRYFVADDWRNRSPHTASSELKNKTIFSPH